MLELNADQRRNLFSTLEQVDKLLSDSEHVLESARSPSLLPEYVCDISPAQHERILDYIARFRVEVSGLLKRHGLMPSSAHKSAAAARSHLPAFRRYGPGRDRFEKHGPRQTVGQSGTGPGHDRIPNAPAHPGHARVSGSGGQWADGMRPLGG